MNNQTKNTRDELSLTATRYRDPNREEMTQVTAQCPCGRGGWIRLDKHPGLAQTKQEITKEYKVGVYIEDRIKGITKLREFTLVKSTPKLVYKLANNAYQHIRVEIEDTAHTALNKLKEG